MKKFILSVTVLLGTLVPSFGQNKNLNSTADSIVGEYFLPDDKNGDSKVVFTKNADATYDCHIIWLDRPIDPSTGKPWLDRKNPDKSLRSHPLNGLYLLKGLKYNAEKKHWDGTKIYDPNRGIKANVTCVFLPSGNLKVSGKVLGIGESQTWIRQ